MEEQKKKQKTYIITEKEYVKAKRDNKRLMIIKPLAKKITAILKHIQESKSDK